MKVSFFSKAFMVCLFFAACNNAEKINPDDLRKNGDDSGASTTDEEDSDVQVPASVSGAFLTCSFETQDENGGCRMNNQDQTKMDITSLKKNDSWKFSRWVGDKEYPINENEVDLSEENKDSNWHIKFELKDKGLGLGVFNQFVSISFNKKYIWNSLSGSIPVAKNSVSAGSNKLGDFAITMAGLNDDKLKNYHIWPEPQVESINGKYFTRNADIISLAANKYKFDPTNFVYKGEVSMRESWSKEVNDNSGSPFSYNEYAKKNVFPYLYSFVDGKDCIVPLNINSDTSGQLVHGHVVEFDGFYFFLVKRKNSYFIADSTNYEPASVLHIVSKASADKINISSSDLKSESLAYQCK